MRQRIANQFLRNYMLMFVLSIIITFFTLVLLDFANHLIATSLVKNNYTAESLMRDDYYQIKTAEVVANGGGLQVIDQDYTVVRTAGLNTLVKDKLSTAEFTQFLMASKSKGIPYNYSIAYNTQADFWLVVTFPTSFRIDLAFVYNENHASTDRQNVIGILVAIVLFYLLLLALSTIIYSKITAIGIVSPLRKLTESARRLRNGDYQARVNLNLKNEFAELQDTFNAMARQIEHEISLKEQAEENRKQLILDVSHDLKNPLSSIMGYAELCLNKPDVSPEQRAGYLQIIYENGARANHLITHLFELSKLESPAFVLNMERMEICEYLREEMGKAIPILDEAGFSYDFDIPDEEVFVMMDKNQMNRVFQNLIINTVQYNSRGTTVNLRVSVLQPEVEIHFGDNGIGMSKKMEKIIFQPFVRADDSRNSQTGGTGLGLAIVAKIIQSHGGRIELRTDTNEGCVFIINLPLC